MELDCFGSERRKTVPRRRLCEILQARCEEILEMVVSEVKRSVHDDILSAGLVLTGGTANLQGIDVLAEQVSGMPVRVGVPRTPAGPLGDAGRPGLRHQRRPAAMGPEREQAALRRSQRAGPSLAVGGWLRRVGHWMRVLMPE